MNVEELIRILKKRFPPTDTLYIFIEGRRIPLECPLYGEPKKHETLLVTKGWEKYI